MVALGGGNASCERPTVGSYGGLRGGGMFLMSEVPLQGLISARRLLFLLHSRCRSRQVLEPHVE